jgi:glucose/arabinose dehydrogenase
MSPASASPSATRNAGSGRPAPADLESLRLKLVPIATFGGGVDLATRVDDDFLYVGQRVGRVLSVHDGETRRVLDISDKVATDGALGLMGVTFSLDGTHLYVSYTDERTLHLVEYQMGRRRADPGTERRILSIRQQTIRHVGGDLALGPDGLLWFSVGDGSLGHDPGDLAQDLRTHRGKLLRIDPEARRGKPYRAPPSNPFVGKPAARPEIFAYGLRNPWKFSFDRATGDLWIGDVGQYHVEEINFLPEAKPSGANFGWSRLEGTRPFSGQAPANHVPPIFEYTHADGCSVIGGVVYRGVAIPELVGAYIYSDLCTGRLAVLVERRGRIVYEQDLRLKMESPVAFGEDADGEVYAVSLTKGLFKIEPA